jgi:hypothetical protein
LLYIGSFRFLRESSLVHLQVTLELPIARIGVRLAISSTPHGQFPYSHPESRFSSGNCRAHWVAYPKSGPVVLLNNEGPGIIYPNNAAQSRNRANFGDLEFPVPRVPPTKCGIPAKLAVFAPRHAEAELRSKKSVARAGVRWRVTLSWPARGRTRSLILRVPHPGLRFPVKMPVIPVKARNRKGGAAFPSPDLVGGGASVMKQSSP